MVLRELWYCHVAVLSFHASSSSNPPRFPCAYPFLIRFSGAVLEVFRNSKWVMRHIFGKLSTSSFQRYKVCTNRSSDEGVMAPGSRGVGAVFVHFSDAKIPVKRGMLSANREFHVVAGVIIFPTHPGSRINLLRAGKTLRAKAALPMSDFDVLGTVGKLALPTFARFQDLRESELGLVRYGPANRGHRGVFGPFEGSFPIGIPARPGKFLAIREFHVVHECVFFPTCPGSRINLLRVRKTLRASVATSVGKFRNFQQNLISSACFHARGRRSSRCRISTILVSSESLCYLLFQRYRPCTEASLGSQDMILRTEAVGMFLMPRGTAKNLPQFACHSLSDALALNRLTHGSKVKLRSRAPEVPFAFLSSTVWNPGSKHVEEDNLRLQICSSLKSGGLTVWHLNPNTLRGDLTWGLPKLQIEWSNGLAFESKHVGEFNLRLQICPSLKLGGSTVWHLNPNTLRGDLTWGLPNCKSSGPTVWNPESKHVGGDLTWGLPKLKSGGSTVWNLSPNTLRGDLDLGTTQAANRVVQPTVWNLSPNTLRGDLDLGTTQAANRVVQRCKSGGSTVWNLSPNTLRGDLTWGLPKLQIGWFNGLESQSKHVEGCKSGGSTVWNLSPNTLRGDLTWGLPKLQIGWFNGLESQSKHVEGCKSGGSTVWNLSPNTLRGDLTWGLPKLQIGWFNGLESQSKHVEGDLTWGLPKLQIEWSNGLESQSKHVEGCLTEVVVAEIVAGPHALDSCECMNIEGAMRAPLRWLLLCLLGRSALASHTLGLAISIPYSRASILSPIWEILQEVSIRLDDVDLQ
uniref:Uncharacterized protein n=1 Tax=Fagus sylvatica TaxID=28930 RepID=A0A2N9FYI9_FAGSY